AQRRADGPLPAPAELLAAVRDRSLAVLGGTGTGTAPLGGGPATAPRTAAATPWAQTARGREGAEHRDLAHHCELALRLALSYVVVPVPDDVGAAVRTALGSPVSGSNLRAAGR
ncbi:hypothetical protein QCN29_01760, partial [Streptomyces sp. HNM0663]|nr:hypothetical protein [Streptomyces chengmaiensis]